MGRAANPSFRKRLESEWRQKGRIASAAQGSGGLRATPSFKSGDDHVSVHYIAESVVERGQRGIVFGLAVGGVAVADHDRAKIQHAGIARGTLAAHIGHRAGDE